MKKSTIKKAMKGNDIWCTSDIYAPGVSPCDDVDCPYKKGPYKEHEGRIPKPKDLKKCRSFQITRPTDSFENSISVLVPKKKRTTGVVGSSYDERGPRS